MEFDKIVPEGRALGHWQGMAVFAVGPLPGETAEVLLTRQKRTWAEAAVRQIIEPSAHRGPAREDHFLSCSPWQGVDYDYQAELKRAMLAESFVQHKLDIGTPEFITAPEPFGYRNKLEFSLQEQGGQLGLAFHERGSWRHLVSLPGGCALGSPAMNSVALELVKRLNKLGIGSDADTLTVRQSHRSGEIIAVLALHQEIKADWRDLLHEGLAGLVVWLPPRHGRPGQLVWSKGRDHLSEEIAGVKMDYPFDSFFQVNISMFEQALGRILAAAPNQGRITELYSGAGTIGLPLAARGAEVTGVEIVASSAELATANARLNQLAGYKAILSPSEKIDPALLDNTDCVILDPPRAGLHRRVITMLLEKLPRRIVYLSCNPVTQARDTALLAERYRLSPVTGFDFYPGTLHLESLIVLDKK